MPSAPRGGAEAIAIDPPLVGQRRSGPDREVDWTSADARAVCTTPPFNTPL